MTNTLNIPSAKPEPDPYMEGLCNILRQTNIDPRKALSGPPLLHVCCAMWRRGEIDEAELRRCLRNLLVMNPALALTVKA